MAKGSRAAGQYAGWPQLGNKTIVDGLAVIGDNNDRYAVAATNLAAAIQRAVTALPTSNPGLTDAQVHTLANDVVAAIRSHPAATPTEIAAATPGYRRHNLISEVYGP